MKEVINFLAQLKANNNREWFEANRKEYERAKENLIKVVGELIGEIKKWDEEIDGSNPKSFIFRINRDTRFSKDKSPYKQNMGAFISKGGRKTAYAGYYLHLEPGASMIAGGIYMPPADDLKRIRQEIDYNTTEFTEIVKDKAFVKWFGKLDDDMVLKTAPKGYEPNNEMLPYLKLKSFTVSRILDDKEVVSPGFMKDAAAAFNAMYPMLCFLNRAVEG